MYGIVTVCPHFSESQGKGTRKNILTRIMVSRSEIDMKRIKEEYKKSNGKTLYQDILVSGIIYFFLMRKLFRHCMLWCTEI